MTHRDIWLALEKYATQRRSQLGPHRASSLALPDSNFIKRWSSCRFSHKQNCNFEERDKRQRKDYLRQ